MKKGAGYDRGRVPGKSINVGTPTSKTVSGAKALAKLGSSKTILPPGAHKWLTGNRKPLQL